MGNSASQPVGRSAATDAAARQTMLDPARYQQLRQFVDPLWPGPNVPRTYVYKFTKEEADSRLGCRVTNNAGQLLMSSRVEGALETFYDIHNTAIMCVVLRERQPTPELRRLGGFQVFIGGVCVVEAVHQKQSPFMELSVVNPLAPGTSTALVARYDSAQNVIVLTTQQGVIECVLRSGSNLDEVWEVTPQCALDPLVTLVLGKMVLLCEPQAQPDRLRWLI
eukprot:TRINITY_DN8498_c0_g1_i7.p1 TRINITY_DN8498_c0_g1~~TRINITY_DN8498_c0_g1_i7.p1  ORF type:complete len:241 (+),score=65.46 TRINITY_DN8498_c0_g1_i7:58-723(+)